MRRIALSAATVMALASCATIPNARPEEIAYCEQMERRMGTDHTHDHSAARGAGIDPMSVTHERCRKMLGLE